MKPDSAITSLLIIAGVVAFAIYYYRLTREQRRQLRGRIFSI